MITISFFTKGGKRSRYMLSRWRLKRNIVSFQIQTEYFFTIPFNCDRSSPELLSDLVLNQLNQAAVCLIASCYIEFFLNLISVITFAGNRNSVTVPFFLISY